MDIASQICNFNCAFSCYKETCPRGSWFEPMYDRRVRQHGNDTECPLRQFDVKRLPKEKRKRNITVEDTWDICASCKYAEVSEDGYISIEKPFKSHCRDCPVHQLRDSIQEVAAEARGCW